jgi:hypothetical protein
MSQGSSAMKMRKAPEKLNMARWRQGLE